MRSMKADVSPGDRPRQLRHLRHRRSFNDDIWVVDPPKGTLQKMKVLRLWMVFKCFGYVSAFACLMLKFAPYKN